MTYIGNYYKWLLLLILMLFITGSLSGCTLYEKPVRAYRTSDISYTIKYSDDATTKTLTKSNGLTSLNFVCIQDKLQKFEDAYYAFLMENPKERSLVGTDKVWQNLDVFELDNGHIGFNVTNISPIDPRAYVVDMDLNTNLASITNGFWTYPLDQQSSHHLLSGGVLDHFFDEPVFPAIKIKSQINGIDLDYFEHTSMTYQLHTDYVKDYSKQEGQHQNASLFDITNNDLQIFFDHHTPTDITLNVYNSYHSLINTLDYPIGNTLTLSNKDLNLENGQYSLEMIINYSNIPEGTSGLIQSTKRIEFDAKVFVDPSFNSLYDTYQPGDLIVIQGQNLSHINDYTIETETYHQGLSSGTNDKGYIFLFPLTSRITPGNYTITFKHKKDSSLTKEVAITIIPKEFDVQYLETSSETASFRNEENYAQLNEAFARGRASLSDEKQWDGPFLQPVGGIISTEYGMIRYTNDDVESSRHGGIDFANPEGTVVYATQNGFITLAEYLNITGNTLFIDHGKGILSQYYHMFTLYVNEGDYVKKGDPIGEVGTTGFSTGPHLHFSIYYSGVYLNPWKFFENPPY